MARKEFYSQLFKKSIKANDPEYQRMVFAEALYRLKEYEEKDCSCMHCQDNRKKLKDFVDKKFKSS